MSSKTGVKTGKADSVEYTSFLLPPMENGDGVVALGDLWNCRTNSAEGNLFDKPLEKEFVSADPIKSLDYTFYRCRNTEEIANMLSVGAELKIDIACGKNTKIKISGKAEYLDEEKKDFRQEVIAVTYDTLTYQVRVRPSASNAVSPIIKKLLADKKIVATHFVQSVILGGQATGSIKYKEVINDSKMNIAGEFQVELTTSKLTIEAKANFQKLDTELKKSYNVSVNLHAQPSVKKSPTNCEEMFQQIENLDSNVNDERHYKYLEESGDKGPMPISGVPIKFRLVPISHIIVDADVDSLFKILKEELMAEFTTMLFILKDYSNVYYIRQRLNQMQPSIGPILLDDMNPLTEKIRKYSMEKAILAKELRNEAAKRYIEYKTSEGRNEELLREMLQRFNEEFNTIQVDSDLIDFKEAGKKELAGIRASDVNGIVDDKGKPSIHFFSNETDLADWYNKERTIKILLKTDFSQASPTGVFLKLYDLSPTLAKYGVEVGVAFPNISDGEFSLSYKTQYETNVYHRPDIRFALEVLSIAVDEGESISKLFYTINASLFGLNLPMTEYLFDVPNLIKVMNIYQGVVICETYTQLLAQLLESYDTWNIVFPIQAIYTSVEMIRFFRQLRVYIPQRFPELKHRFIVSSFNNVSDKFYSPLLLLFKDDTFQAVCLDQLDILIMMEQFSKEDPDMSLISFERVRKSCLYTPRADWAISVIQNLVIDHRSFISDPIEELKGFPDNQSHELLSAMEVARVSAIRNEPEVLTAVAHLLLQDKPSTQGNKVKQLRLQQDDPNKQDKSNEQNKHSLEALLSKHGWRDDKFSPATWNKIEWTKFVKDIKAYLSEQDPFMMKVALALEELKNIENKKKSPSSGGQQDNNKDKNGADTGDKEEDDALNKLIDKNVSFIDSTSIQTDPVAEALRNQVLSYAKSPAKVRQIAITKLFEKFIADKSKETRFFDMFNFLYLVQGMQDEQFKSLKHVLLPMCKRYCERLAQSNIFKTYPRGERRLNDSLTEKQLFKTVGVLSEIRYDPSLYLIHQELFNMNMLPAPMNVKNVIDILTGFIKGVKTIVDKENLEEKLKVVWTNPKFLYILRQVLKNEGVLEALFVHVYEWSWYNNEMKNTKKNPLMMGEFQHNMIEVDEVDDDDVEMLYGDEAEDLKLGEDFDVLYPYWIPPDVTENIKAMIILRKGPMFYYPKEWNDVQIMIEVLKIITTRKVMPRDFSRELQKNVKEYQKVREELEELGLLFYWNNKEELFETPWSLSTITKVLDGLMVKYPENPLLLPIPEYTPIVTFQVNNVLETSTVDAVIVNSAWRKLVDEGALKAITYDDFTRIRRLRPIARTVYDEIETSVNTLLSYLSQQLRTMNASSLLAHFFESYIQYPPPGQLPGVIDFGDGIPNRNKGFLLTRGDFQSVFFQLSDPAVMHLSLMSMAKTPIPLPLMIPTIEQLGPGTSTTPVIKDSSTVVTKSFLYLSSLQDIIVPEMESLVPQPRLFRHPYRFVLTLRIGGNCDNIGRSSLINQHLMRDVTTFSSKMDPGSTFGVPLNRSGFLEFIWLSESTCDPQFWANHVKKEYESQRKQMILLGILHGDSLSFPSLFEVVKPYVSSYVVFWKVANFTELKIKKKALTSIIGQRDKVFDVVLYPDPTVLEKVQDQSVLFKQIHGEYQHLVNKSKLQNIFADAISYTVKTSGSGSDITSIPNAPTSKGHSLLSSLTTPKGSKPLNTSLPIEISPSKPISTPESIKLISFIRHQTIGNIQQALKIPSASNKTIIDTLVLNFTALLSLPEKKRRSSFLHFMWELDLLSRTSSSEWVIRLHKLRQQIQDKYHLDSSPGPKWTLMMQQEMRIVMEQLRRNTLSLQDLWRALWIFTNSTKSSQEVNNLISLKVDYLKAGFPIEMFHPSYTDKVWGNGLSEVIKTIPDNTRIMVISTIGLKGSGKSTLLNNLFGLGFTEYGTTYGLQLRLLWLSDQLQEKLDCDAFILIDSEGVGGAENKIDVGVDEQERKLVTFLLAISSLSLISVLGSELLELSSILEVSLVSLCKLHELLQLPDVFMVQQLLPDKGGAEVDVGRDFSNSLMASIKTTLDYQLRLGIRETESKRLKQLKSKDQHGEILHSLRSRESIINQEEPHFLDYHHDVQLLYEKIIHLGQTSKALRINFGDWIKSTEELWEQIQSIDAPYRYSSAEDIKTSIEFEQNMDELKSFIDSAFFYHEKKVEAALNGEVNGETLDKLFNDNTSSMDAKIDLRLKRVIAGLQKVINNCDDLASKSSSGGSNKLMTNQTAQTPAAPAEPNPYSCLACSEAFKKREELLQSVRKQPRHFLIEEDVTLYTNSVRNSIFERLNQGLLARQIREGLCGHLEVELQRLSGEYPDDKDKSKLWNQLLQYVSIHGTVIPSRHLFHFEVEKVWKSLPHIVQAHSPDGPYIFSDLKRMVAFDVQIHNSALESAMNQKKPEMMTWTQHDWLMARLRDLSLQLWDGFECILYRIGMARELRNRIQALILLFEEFCGEALIPEFKWQIHIYEIQLFSQLIDEKQKAWDLITVKDESQDPPVERIKSGGNPLQVLKMMKSSFDKGELTFEPKSSPYHTVQVGSVM